VEGLIASFHNFLHEFSNRAIVDGGAPYHAGMSLVRFKGQHQFCIADHGNVSRCALPQ
jgi:hypothetical protein